jgi:hypothetical protein
MYQPTRLPSRGTKGTLVLVKVLRSLGASRRGPSLLASAACSGSHQAVGGKQHRHAGPKRSGVGAGADIAALGGV